MEYAVGRSSRARPDLIEDRVAREGQFVPPTTAEHVGLKPGQGPATFQVGAQRVEVRLRNIWLTDQLLDLFREKNTVLAGLIEEPSDRIGGHRGSRGIGQQAVSGMRVSDILAPQQAGGQC